MSNILHEFNQNEGTYPPEFNSFRRSLDERVSDHYGGTIMPRLSILYPEYYEQSMAGDMICDETGSPLACAFDTAYPDREKDRTDLSTAAYLLQPVWEVVGNDAKLDLIRQSGFQFIVADIVVPDLYEGAPPVDPEVWQVELTALSIEAAKKQVRSVSDKLRLLDETGTPLFHYEYVCSSDNDAKLVAKMKEVGGKFVHTWSDRALVKEHVDDLSDHHIGIFAEHSKKSAPISLGRTTKEEVEELLDDEGYIVVVHLNDANKIDASIIATGDFSQMPCIDPNGFDNPSGVYVESLSSDPSVRGEGVAYALTGYGLHEFLRFEEGSDSRSFSVAFDTAGPSTYVVPAFAASVITETGFTIDKVRTQSIHFVTYDL